MLLVRRLKFEWNSISKEEASPKIGQSQFGVQKDLSKSDMLQVLNLDIFLTLLTVR